MTPFIANMKLKWLLLFLLFLVVCKPTASCGTVKGGREQLAVSIHPVCGF